MGSDRPTRVSGTYEVRVVSRLVPEARVTLEAYVSRVTREETSLVLTPPSQAWEKVLRDAV